MHAEVAGDVLVLIEPGTPNGSANILEARAHILELEHKKLHKLNARIDGSADVVRELHGNSTKLSASKSSFSCLSHCSDGHTAQHVLYMDYSCFSSMLPE